MAKNRQEDKTELMQRKEQRRKVEKQAKRKEILCFSIMAVVAILLFVAFLWKVSGTSGQPQKTEAFTVDGMTVYMDEVNFCILQNVVDLGIGEVALDTTAEDGSSADSYYKQEIMDMILDYKVEAEVARKRGISLTKDEEASVSQDVANYIGTINGSVLRQLGVTKDRIQSIYEERYLAHKLEETVTSDIELEDVTYCTMYMLLFPKMEMDADGGYTTEEGSDDPIPLTDAEINKRKEDAETAYQQLKDGADIAELAKQYGVEKYSGEQSNTPEGFGEPFDAYAETLQDGEYSPVLDISSCYAIVQMKQSDNEEIAEQIAGYYRSDLEKDAIAQNRTKWYEEAGVDSEQVKATKAWDKVTLYDFVKYVEE